MKQHVSLKDVARRAGVSYQTISKVLNNKGTVAPATRARILDAARELGYVPNALARGLVTQNSSLIGVVASDMSQTILSQPLVGIEREARRLGYDVIIGSVGRSGDNSEAVIRTLLERRVDGILFAAPMLESDRHLASMLPSQLPVVSTHDIVGASVPIVRTDEHQLGVEAANHLLSFGHARIGTIIGDHKRHVSRLRLEGFQDGLQRAGIPAESLAIEEGNWDVEGAYQATHRLLDRRSPPTAIFVQNDTMAIGTLAAAHDRGLLVPVDIAVIGCDDIPVAARTIPPLTTFRMQFDEVGELAMRLLASHIAGQSNDSHEVLLPASLVYRASSGRHRERNVDEGPLPARPVIASTSSTVTSSNLPTEQGGGLSPLDGKNPRVAH